MQKSLIMLPIDIQ